MSPTVLVLGATSGIGRAMARRLADTGYDLILAARNVEELQSTASDCSIRFGIGASTVRFDARAFDEHAQMIDECWSLSEGGPEGVVICHGEMAEEATARQDFAVARRMIDTNFTSMVSVLEKVATRMAERRSGWICAFSSVAGDRGRPSNYLYGSTKAALSTYLQGLRARLASRGVSVVAVKPGFVDTALTYGRSGMFAVASPELVAAAALRGVRRDRAVVYTPWFWALIMLAIRLLPDRVFKRLPL